MSTITACTALRRNKRQLFVVLGLSLLCLGAALRPDPFGTIRSSAELRAQLEAVTLTDQAGRAFSLQELRGEIVLLNFVFTQCSGVCPLQTQRLKNLKAQIEAEHPEVGLKLVSVSLTPELDTSEVLAGYARRYGIPPDGSWRFLTGENRAVGAVMDALGMKTSPSDANFLDHLTNVYLFDREGRLKKQYDGAVINEKLLVREIVSLSRVSP